MAGSTKNFLHPKVGSGKLGERVKDRGMFKNVPGYVKFGGFSSADKYGRANDMNLERGGPSSRKGKPI